MNKLTSPSTMLLTAALLSATTALHATDKTWSNASQSAWNTPGNWSPSGVPTTGDDIVTPSAFGNILMNVTSATVNSWTYNGTSSQVIIGNNGATGSTLNVTGTLSKSNSGNLTFRASGAGNPLTLSVGAIALNGGLLSLGIGGSLTGVTAGSVSVTSGTLALVVGTTSGTVNVTGDFSVAGSGVVNLREAGSAGQIGVLNVGSMSSASATSVVRVNNNSLVANATSGTLVLNNASGAATFAGSVQSGGTAGNTMSVIKNGVGAQEFSGANTYTGATIVTAGTLLVNGTHTGAGAYAVTGGTLGGTGTITTAGTAGTTIGASAFLAAGSGGIGSLTFAGGSSTDTLLTLSSNAQIRLDLGAAGLTVAAPGSSDRLVFTTAAAGDVVFTNTNIDFLGTGTDGYYKLFDTDLASGTTWSGLTLSGQTITSGLNVTNLAGGLTGTLFVGNGVNGDLNDIYLVVAVPEPGSVLLTGAGLAFLMIFRRRRVA